MSEKIPDVVCGNCLLERSDFDFYEKDFSAFSDYLMVPKKYTAQPGYKYKCPICGWFFSLYITRGPYSFMAHVDFISRENEFLEIKTARRELVMRQIKIFNYDQSVFGSPATMRERIGTGFLRVYKNLGQQEVFCA